MAGKGSERSSTVARIGMFARAVLVLAIGPIGIEVAAQEPASSLAQRFQALLQECRTQGPSFRKATSSEERRAAVENLDGFAPRFLALAEEDPHDAVALDALVEAVRTVNAVDSLTQVAWDMGDTLVPDVHADRAADQAVALLIRDHLRSERLGPVCLRMSYGIREPFAAFLRAALETNPAREVKAHACLALAQFLNSRLDKLALMEDRPGFAERFAGLLGPSCLEELRSQDRAAALAEVEGLFERCAASYGEVAHPYGGTIGEKARSELYEIHHLAVGREAPDIEGLDQHGQRFRLSDYRGKVVLLDFWQEY